MMKKIFRMPTPVKIVGRTSSITNAFVNGIIPVIEPTEEEIEDVLATLGMNKKTIQCSYCGDRYTEWDHFYPLIKDKLPTGYISEIHNLVPACGKCNQSKGNKYWKDWMLSDAALSPKTRRIPDLEEKIHRLEIYENKYKPTKINFEDIVGKEKWKKHWENCERLRDMMRESQVLSDEIKLIVLQSLKTENSVKKGNAKKIKSTETGFININNQRNNGRTDIEGTDNLQWFYDMECLNCGQTYRANGTNIYEKKCPKCQNGKLT